MIEFLQNIDNNLFLKLNGLHNATLDSFMFCISQKYWIWIPLYLFILVLIIRKYKTKSWLPILSIIILITLSDQISSSVIKQIVERLRPTHNPAFEGLVHIVNGYKGGMYGFVSSHAANSFALTAFCILLFRKKPLAVLMISWALLSSYSRIYLGVHYPGDVICGAALGVILGIMVYKLLTHLFTRKFKDETHFS